jgi:dTDP-L-rhamnose 4-epimerase
VSILQVADALARAMGLPHLQPELVGKARTGDIRHCFADIGRAASVLGFTPKRSFDDSLGELVEWVRPQQAVDLVHRARQELEQRGLVA